MGRSPSNAKQEIVAAAYRVLGAKGVDGASIKEIAQEAGVAPGLVHYYFTNKEELLLEVLRTASDQYTRIMAGVPEGAVAGGATDEPRNRVEREPEWYRLRYELFAMGLRNPAIRSGVAALLASGRQGISAVVSRMAPVPNPEAVAAVLLACFDGLALQKLADPAFDLEAAYAVVDRLAESLKGAR